MKPSEYVWKYLEDNEQETRGEATELFAEAMFVLFDENGSGNGVTLNALELALDELCKDENKLTRFNKWFEAVNSDEEDE